jgi:hypothetical protein
MDENLTMNMSVMQYLEGIRTIMKDSYANKSFEKLDLLESTPNELPQDSADHIDFGLDRNKFTTPEKQNPFDFDPFEGFDQKMSLDDNLPENQSVGFNLENNDEEMQDQADVKIRQHKTSKPDKKSSEDDDSQVKSKLSNKERARRARQRKKKYYEDLESKVGSLEKENVKLTEALRQCRQKIKFLENKGDSYDEETNSQEYPKTLMNDCINMFQNLPPEREGLLKMVGKMAEKFGPYGTAQIKIMDSYFESIIQNYCNQACKLVLY